MLYLKVINLKQNIVSHAIMTLSRFKITIFQIKLQWTLKWTVMTWNLQLIITYSRFVICKFLMYSV